MKNVFFSFICLLFLGSCYNTFNVKEKTPSCKYSEEEYAATSKKLEKMIEAIEGVDSVRVKHDVRYDCMLVIMDYQKGVCDETKKNLKQKISDLVANCFDTMTSEKVRVIE